MKIKAALISLSIYLLLLIQVEGQFVSNTPFTNQKNQGSTKLLNFPAFNAGYYIIAGVFTVRENATVFYNELKKKGFYPSIYYSNENQKIYVSLEYSTAFETLQNKLADLSKSESLDDLWILNISDEKEINSDNNYLKKIEKKTEKKTENKNRQPLKKSAASNVNLTHNHYILIVNVHDNNSAVPATVEIINGEITKSILKVASNNPVSFDYSKAENQTIKLSCEKFGFHKATLNLNLANPINEGTLRTVKKSGDTIIVDIALEQPKKGDIMTLYNVFFFPNSNAVKKSSTYELQQLLNLFKENPDLKIKIHGHTNGNMLGSFIKINKNSKDIFSSDDHKKVFGTSGTLSRLRSSTIKRYLISNGVSKNNIEVKGWGGKRMIHKQHSPMAEYNIRVEVEILKD